MTNEKIEELKRMYAENKTAEEIAIQLKITVGSVRNKAWRLGITNNKEYTEEEKEQKEIELILLYKSNQREYGYNIDNGGNVKGKISEETRKKMSDLKRGKKPWNYKKIGLLKATNETKVKMSIAHKGKKPWNKGKSNPHSDEMKKNMSKSMKGKIPSAITQKKARESNIVHIKKYSLDGVFICEYESIIDASKEIGLNRSSSHISECCQGKKKTAYGFMWSYSEVK